jgi:hypothetical protein
MSRPPQLTHWHAELASRLPGLPAPVVFGLALYSFGVLLARVSGFATVVLFLAKHLGWPYRALRKRLREFYLEAPAKSGARQGHKRRDFDPAGCFAPLLRWVLSLWAGRHLPLAIDVTNLGERFHVLCVSVVVRGVAIPVAWKVLLGGVKEPWGPHWQALLGQLRPAVPEGWVVLVLSDRGLESPGLFAFVVGLGWHPLMRVKAGGKFRPKTWHGYHDFASFARQPGATYAAAGQAYVGQRLPGTLLARWEQGYAEPWLLLTDLPPQAASAAWYGLRAWVEQGFKVIKGGGWDWQRTRMEDPGRVERLWLVLAVATLWAVALGADDEAREQAAAQQRRLEQELARGQQEAQARQEQARRRAERQRQALQALQGRRQELRAKRQAGRRAAQAPAQAARPDGQATAAVAAGPAGPASSGRAHAVTARGLAEWAAQGWRGQTRLPRHLHPEPWPPPTHTPSTLTEQEFLSQPT